MTYHGACGVRYWEDVDLSPMPVMHRLTSPAFAPSYGMIAAWDLAGSESRRCAPQGKGSLRTDSPSGSAMERTLRDGGGSS